ncbi:platelet endothelial cell adhesion molecule isoform X2 [Dicentrarchus labrax]|uniref:platelet endothelial cell adhesion molecule isoform X2 n=1 Tax=Dicentrarchus labrax TaxID=13489 RepID=UPI0021F5DD03|nr:platelet endothelial cell adhesion molecule isoform X2 [Dicentrarchus labrax]
MDSRPPNLLLLLLTSLLYFWQCARVQASYTIDNVGLTVQPSSTVESGTPVTLRCQVRVSHDNIPHLTHTFQLTQDDVLVSSSTTTEDSVVYKLSPARAADSGSYQCRVTVKEKSKASESKKLDVTGLQTPILYLNKTTPYQSEEFTATCSAPGEKGALVFQFHQRFRGGNPEKIKQAASTGNSSETTLVLSRLGNSILYCDYEVGLVSGVRRSNRSNEISVLVKALHITPIMNILPSSNVSEGDIIEVVCRVVSDLKNIEVFLTRDRRILKQALVSLSHRFTTKEGDSGELVCKAEWGNVQQKSNQTIRVKELFSKPHLTVSPTDIFEGHTFELTCSVSSYDPQKIENDTMLFSIYKDGVELKNGTNYHARAGPSANGNYSCKVKAHSLDYHNFSKDSKSVVVEAKVPVSEPMLSVVGGTLVLEKPFQLICHSDRGTLPIVYTLYAPKRPAESRKVSKPWEQAIFNSSAIYKNSDLKKFLCHARNSLNEPPMTSGQQLLDSTIIIEPVSKPVLRDVSDGQDVNLVCSVQKGTPPITFTWYHTKKAGALDFQTTKKLEGSYRISHVKGEHKGEYYCESTNLANKTKMSDTISIGVKLAGWKKGLIAAFCILVILALILVIIFKRRLLGFKRKTTAELSVKTASTNVERLSLTQAVNVTPGMIGKSVWSDYVSGSESDDQYSVTSPGKPEPQFIEAPTKQADPTSAQGTDNEVRNSKQGVPEPAESGSVEYAQLNRDVAHHSNHGDHSVQDDYSVQDDHMTDSSVANNTADHGE